MGLAEWKARCQETTHLSGCTSREMHDKQLTSICSRRAIYFKWHFCFLSKSTRVTWINPLHPESAPSYKATGAVCSAGAYWPVPWDSCVPFPPQLLQLHKEKKNSVGWLPKSKSSLPHQTKVSPCISFPSTGTKYSWAIWPPWSSSSKKKKWLGLPKQESIHWFQGSHTSS